MMRARRQVRGGHVSDKAQLDRVEELLTQLIGNVTAGRAEHVEFRAEMQEFRADMEQFRCDVNERFARVEDRLERVEDQVVLLNHRIDFQLHRIAKPEEEVHLLKHRQS